MSVANNMNRHTQSSYSKTNSEYGLSSFGGTNPFNRSNNNENSFKVNPMVFPSLKNLDVNKLEEDLAKEIQRKKILEERERKNIQKIFEESDEIKDLKNKIKFAQINQERSKQILEKQSRRLQDIVKDAEQDEYILSTLEEEKFKQMEEENRKRNERLHSKHVLQNQMSEKEKLRDEARAEYLRDKSLVDDIVKKIMMEDMQTINEIKKKKELAKTYMKEAYEEKEMKKHNQKEEERLQKEREKQYFEEVARRDKDIKEKKAAIQGEKDKIFEKLSAEAARQQAEKDYWENVRNELYVEEMNRREKIKDLQEKEKKQR